MKKIVIVLLLILILAALTKPSEDNFNDFIKSEMKNTNDDVFTKIIKGGLNIQSQLTTVYKDKMLYSTVKTKIANEKIEYIGLFGTWIRIN